jgi:hypothetical protein
MVSGRPDSRNVAVGAAADDNQPVIRLLYISCFHLIKHIETTSRDSVIWPQ